MNVCSNVFYPIKTALLTFFINCFLPGNKSAFLFIKFCLASLMSEYPSEGVLIDWDNTFSNLQSVFTQALSFTQPFAAALHVTPRTVRRAYKTLMKDPRGSSQVFSVTLLVNPSQVGDL